MKFRRLLAVIWHCRARIDYKIQKHTGPYSTRFGRYCVLSTNHRESIYFAIILTPGAYLTKINENALHTHLGTDLDHFSQVATSTNYLNVCHFLCCFLFLFVFLEFGASWHQSVGLGTWLVFLQNIPLKSFDWRWRRVDVKFLVWIVLG